MDWFRWYHGTCSDPKLAGIARRLKLPRPAVIAVWAMVLESASSGGDRGALKHDADDIAAALDMKTPDVARVLDQMRAITGPLLTEDTVTSWCKRQFKSDDVTARVRSTRDKSKQDRNDDETLHKQPADVSPPPQRNAPETETETETERSPVAPKGAIDLAFERLWKAYPHRGKEADPRKPAAAKFAQIVKAGGDPETIIRGAEGYARAQGGKDPAFNKQLIAWLNQAYYEQYAVDPAPSTPTLGNLTPDESDRLHRLERLVETGKWFSHYGPEPLVDEARAEIAGLKAKRDGRAAA